MIVLPDVIAPTLRYLATVSEVTDLVGDKIGVELPTTANWPAVRFDPIGGITPVEWRLDQPNLQVQCFAVAAIDAMTLARIMRAAFFAMVGYREPNVLSVVDVDTSSPRLIEDSDREPNVSHATFTATVTVRPDP